MAQRKYVTLRADLHLLPEKQPFALPTSNGKVCPETAQQPDFMLPCRDRH